MELFYFHLKTLSFNQVQKRLRSSTVWRSSFTDWSNQNIHIDIFPLFSPIKSLLLLIVMLAERQPSFQKLPN